MQQSGITLDLEWIDLVSQYKNEQMASRRIEEYFIHQRSENQQRLSVSDVLDVKSSLVPD